MANNSEVGKQETMNLMTEYNKFSHDNIELLAKVRLYSNQFYGCTRYQFPSKEEFLSSSFIFLIHVITL